jgi:MFS transporter, SP family, sugar:H+ symporter
MHPGGAVVAEPGTSPRSDQNTAYVTLLALGAALGGFLFGFDTSTVNSAINGIRHDLGLSAGAVGFVTAISLIGAAIGAWFAGPVSTRIGRDRVMLLAGLLITAGSVVAAVAGAVLLLATVRVLTGLGIGAASAVVPSYISEIAPTGIRGRLGTFWQFAIVIGQFLGLLSGYLLAKWAGSEAAALPWGGAAWRWMFGVVAVLGLVYVLVARGLPRSPLDLIRAGDAAQAQALLRRIGGDSPDERLASIQDALHGQQRTAKLRDLRGSRFGLQGIVWVGILLAAFQQLVGINVVKTYSNALWQAVGFSTSASFLISLITVGVSVASTVVAIAVMDRLGRRTLLVAGVAVMVPALAALAVSFAQNHASGAAVRLEGGAAVTALVAINVFAVAFGITWGPVMWLMLSELFDSELRTAAVAVCTAVNWLTNWVVTRTFPVLAGAGLSFAYGLYTLFAVLAFVFALKALPETRGRTLS